MSKQDKTHRYREQIGGYQKGRGWTGVGEIGEGGQLYGNGW